MIQLQSPIVAFVSHDDSEFLPLQKQTGAWAASGVEVRLSSGADSLSIKVHCPSKPLARVAIRWSAAFAEPTLFLADHWERGYGDMQWRHLQAERIMPWYFTAHDPHTKHTFCCGVMTQPETLCFWTVDSSGVTLWLDFRNGGSPSIPGDQVISAATVVTMSTGSDATPFAAIKRFCKRLCPRPRLADRPICGNNNWYYAYGQNFDQHQVLRDARLLADLAAGHSNKPYCVIDAGWSPGGGCPGGPWTHGLHDKFPDMAGLAADIEKIGVLPGIWMRPTALSTVTDPRRLRPGPQNSAEKALDLTLPENLQLIREDVSRIRSWGYKLIKHDFSCWDIFARWGFDFGHQMTDPGWHFADRSLTNAQIILRLYRTLREAAGDALLIGCNTIGHLGAGLFELQRVGDDTSGRVWERTRKMGINTLAFRLPQHNTFFQCDADCVAHTEHTPWEKDRQFLDLVAHSGTPLFISIDPVKIQPEVRQAARTAMQLALSGGTPGTEPLDWLTNTCPTRWQIGGKEVRYDWSLDTTPWPLRC